MEERHGGDRELIRRIETKAVNVLSLIYSRVYFPACSNDLKSVAGCLGFRWSVPGASGMQSVVWRHDREEARDDALKQRLLAYNEEDCLALERVVGPLRAIVTDLDRAVARNVGDEDFVTAALVEERGGTLTIVNCGHPSPLLLRRGHRRECEEQAGDRKGKTPAVHHGNPL